MMDACHSAFAQTHRTCTTTSDSEWKLGILGDDDESVHGGSSTVTNAPLWRGMWTAGEPVRVWGQEACGNSLNFLSILL